MAILKKFDNYEIVEQSWKRCQNLGLHPLDHTKHIQLIDQTELQEAMKENKELIHYTLEIFEKLSPFIKKTGHVAALINASGTVLQTGGDPQFEANAKHISLHIGANWKEEYRGTNAMGVALIEQKPIRIHGEQHFLSVNHFLTCAASPIFSPTGELLGVFNISGKKELYSPHTLSLVCMITDLLENKFLLAQSKREHLLTIKELEAATESNPHPLLSLDKENRIIRANRAARHILGEDCIGKEFKNDKGYLTKTIRDETNKYWRSIALFKDKHQPSHSFDTIWGSCPHIERVKTLSKKASQADLPVLLNGESGTGKELFAKAIHNESNRSSYPFMAVNCGAIPDNLIESELFGYEPGSFTGANRSGKKGKFEAAQKGTIFLDEIGDMSLRAQVTLLRVLQEKEITRVGGIKSIPIDVRIICATHKNLSEEIKQGRFRADLYFRLKGIQILLPSLRERTDKIELAHKILTQIGVSPQKLSKQAQELIEAYTWPGNIRELNGALTQASFLAEDGEIYPEHFQLEHSHVNIDYKNTAASIVDAEINAIKTALDVNRWNVKKTAEQLQISRSTLYRKLKVYNIEPS
ncbi:sigma-54-dependent Fis family transcriptional regulator [Fredinandcohnia humi]